jgi:hypothetical protein
MQEYLANQTLISTIAWTADRSSAAFPMTQYDGVGIQIVWTSLTGTLDGVVTVYVSNDGTNWDDIGTPTTISTASGNQCIGIEDVYFAFIKVIAVKNGVTGGTISVSATLK